MSACQLVRVAELLLGSASEYGLPNFWRTCLGRDRHGGMHSIAERTRLPRQFVMKPRCSTMCSQILTMFSFLLHVRTLQDTLSGKRQLRTGMATLTQDGNTTNLVQLVEARDDSDRLPMLLMHREPECLGNLVRNFHELSPDGLWK